MKLLNSRLVQRLETWMVESECLGSKSTFFYLVSSFVILASFLASLCFHFLIVKWGLNNSTFSHLLVVRLNWINIYNALRKNPCTR